MTTSGSFFPHLLHGRGCSTVSGAYSLKAFSVTPKIPWTLRRTLKGMSSQETEWVEKLAGESPEGEYMSITKSTTSMMPSNWKVSPGQVAHQKEKPMGVP